jgi:hypothetical protein
MELLGLAILALLLLVVALFVAAIPLVWFLVAAALFFSGAIGPAFGCVLVGLIVSAVASLRSD